MHKIFLINLTADHKVFLPFYLGYTKIKTTLQVRTNSRAKYYVVIEKHRVQKRPFLDFSNLEREGYRLDKTALNILFDYSDPKKQSIEIDFAYSASSAYNTCSIFVNNLNCHFM